MIFFGENSLRRAVREYLSHYHRERNHQGLENKIIDPDEEVGQIAGNIECRERLGGMLRYYYRDAASLVIEAKTQCVSTQPVRASSDANPTDLLIQPLHNRIRRQIG